MGHVKETGGADVDGAEETKEESKDHEEQAAGIKGQEARFREEISRGRYCPSISTALQPCIAARQRRSGFGTFPS